MVKLLFILGIFALLGCFACFCVIKLIRLYYNYKALRHEQKHPGSLPRSEGGIVFNKETGKLEETPGQTILPFD